MFFDSFAGSCSDDTGINIPGILRKEPNIINISHSKYSSAGQRGKLARKEVIFFAHQHGNAQAFLYLVMLPDIGHEDSQIYFNFDIVIRIAIRKQEENGVVLYIAVFNLPVLLDPAAKFFKYKFLRSFICGK